MFTRDALAVLVDLDVMRDPLLGRCREQGIGARDSCGTTCVEPIDGACVQGCKSARKGCDNDAKKNEKICQAACPNGEGRRACMRDCRKLKNADLAICSDREVVCIAGCAGIIP